MTIREAKSSDSPMIQLLLEQLGYPNIGLKETKHNLVGHKKVGYRVLVAEIDRHVVGFIALHCFRVMHWRQKMGRISSLCVEDGFRSRGIGRQLLRAGEEWLISKGCLKLEVTSNDSRMRAHEFYLALGWVEDSRRFVKYLKR